MAPGLTSLQDTVEPALEDPQEGKGYSEFLRSATDSVDSFEVHRGYCVVLVLGVVPIDLDYLGNSGFSSGPFYSLDCTSWIDVLSFPYNNREALGEHSRF